MSPSRTGRLATILTLAAVTLAAACGGDATSRPPDAATPSADAAATPDAAPAPPDAHATHDAAVGSTLTVTVPASYSGAPRQLAVVATKTVPIAGVPDAILLVDNTPAVSAGATLSLTLDTSGTSGDLYVVAVLYQQGGGQFTPKSGVDYVAQSSQTFHFTGAPIALGTLPLVIAP